jgi:DNA-binding MarR family transcriptional regulator
MSGARTRFDRTIHAPHRLRVCSMLAEVKELEFATLRDTLSLSDSVLSKQVAVLTQAGYVRSRRAKREARQRVWLALTREGRAAFAGHVAALREIVGEGSEQDSAPVKRTPAPAVPTPGALGPGRARPSST